MMFRLLNKPWEAQKLFRARRLRKARELQQEAELIAFFERLAADRREDQDQGFCDWIESTR